MIDISGRIDDLVRAARICEREYQRRHCGPEYAERYRFAADALVAARVTLDEGLTSPARPDDRDALREALRPFAAFVFGPMWAGHMEIARTGDSEVLHGYDGKGNSTGVNISWSDFERARRALLGDAETPSPQVQEPSKGEALAPWYEADGSTVMLPAEEVERRRKLAAKVLDAARNLLDRRNLDGSLTVTRKFCDPLDRAIRDLDARPSPRGTGTEGGK